LSKEVLAEPVQKQTESSKSGERLEESPGTRQTADGRILQLQRVMGNRRVGELIRSGQITRDGRLLPIQTRLRVGAPDDPCEQEAERVARQVVSTPDAVSSAPSERKNGNGSSASAVARAASIRPLEPDPGNARPLSPGIPREPTAIEPNAGPASAASVDTAIPTPVSRVGIKEDAPSIQRAWYNFNIPFTNYQFDPSLEGLKTAANVVKDTAVGAFDWIVDQIKSLVSSGIDWLKDKWNSLEESATSAFESAKNAFTNILGLIKSPLSVLADSLMSLDAQALSKAWATFSGLITKVGNEFKAMTDGLLEQVNKAWSGINGFATSLLNRVSSLTENFLFKKLPDALQKIAFSVIDGLKSLWKSINDGWTKLFNKIKAWVDKAIDTVVSFVRKVGSFGINVVIAGIVEFGHLVLFLKDLFSNPQKYVELLAQRSVQAFDGVESRFAGLIGQYFGTAKAAPAPATAGGTKVQRQAVTAAPAEAKTSATWSEIGTGVLEMMGKKWDAFKSNPLAVITGMLLDMVFPLAGNIKDIIKLYQDIKNVVTGPLGASSLEEFWTSFLKLLDIPILIYHTIVSILMRTTMLPLIVATFIPHPLVKAIAAAVGYALLGAFVNAEVMNLEQKLLLLKTGATTGAEKKEAYNRIADSLLALAMAAAIIIILLILNFIANLLKGVYNFVKGKIFNIEPAPAKGTPSLPETKKPTEPKSPDLDPSQPKRGTVKDPPPEDIAASEPIEGGGKVEVTKDGECLICASPCQTVDQLKIDYKEVIDDPDPANDAARAKLDAADKIDGKANPEAKSKAEAEAAAELKKARAAKQSNLLGKTNYQALDPTTGQVITDIDHFEPNQLWEEKSATDAIDRMTGADKTAKWVRTQITEKFAKILRARQELPGWRNADIGFEFTTPGADPAFKAAVEAEIARLRAANPNVNILTRWR